MTQLVYLSLGSNLGDRRSNLQKALHALRRELAVVAVSSVYETAPVGVEEQSPFLNLAVSARTEQPPLELLATLKQIELAVGRKPTYRWGPRVLDIDIIMYGDERVELPELTVPHVEMANRAFVLVPLAEIAGDAVHPVLQVTVNELLTRVSGKEGVVPAAPPA